MSTSGATSFYSASNDNIVVSYGYLNSFLRPWEWNYSIDILSRMCGPFWEPSIFGTMIVVAISFLVLFKFKSWKLMLATYIPCLILTQSTGAYLLAAICVLIFIGQNIKNDQKRRIVFYSLIAFFVISLVLVLGPLLPYLEKLLPSIFGKFTNENSSSAGIRFNSLSLFFEVFLKSPIFGFGPNGAMKEYQSLILSSDKSATSTFGFIIACYGIPGFLLIVLLFVIPFFYKTKTNLETKLSIAILLILVLNLENMIFVTVIMMLTLYFCKEYIFGDKCIMNSNDYGNQSVLSIITNKNSTDSHKVYKNLGGSLIVKVFSMVAGLLTVPIYNTFFGTDELYGVWVVLISILSWSLMLDFGFGSGLRVRLADALDIGDKQEQRKIIASTYVGTTTASTILFLLSLLVVWVVDFNSLLNVNTNILSSLDLKICMTILSFGMCLQFTLKNAVYILFAQKKATVGSLVTFLSSFAVLLVFIFFKDVFTSELFIFAAIIYAIAINTPLLITNFLVFASPIFKDNTPKISDFSCETCKSVMSFGIWFFIIQIGFVALAETNSLFISWIYDPASVADYTKYTKFFTAIIALMGAVVQQPIWSAISSASLKKEFSSIKKYEKITLGISIVLLFLCIICGLFLQFIFNIWLGSNTIEVNYLYVLFLLFYSACFLISDAFIIIANGLKMLKQQALILLVSAIIKITIVMLLKYGIIPVQNLGWGVLLIVDGVCFLSFAIVLPISINHKIKMEELKNEN
jgi:O-antigen/teichoic acid export membrane protein